MKKIYLLAAIILFIIKSYSQNNCQVAYYPFSGNAADYSGYGNDGDVNNAVSTIDRFGNANSAFQFNATTDNIFVPNSTSLQLTTPYTICVWIKPVNGTYGTGPNYHSILQKWGNSGNASYLIGLTPSGLPRFSTHNGVATTNLQGTNPVPFNVWTFIVMKQKNDSSFIYINGALDTIRTGMNIPMIMNNDLLIGQNGIGLGPGDAFEGIIDDVRMYHCALTSTEIQQLYTSNCIGTSTTITANGNTTFCSNSNILLTAPQSLSAYQWQKGGVNISGANIYSYTANATGNYRCITTCGTSTSTSNTIQLTKLANASVTVSASGSTTFCAGGSTTLTATNPGAGYTFQWYRGNISINGATALSYNAGNPGTYKIISKNTSTGCTRISNGVAISVNCRLSNPGLISGSIEYDNNLIVYPNPTAGTFTVELNEEENIDGNAVIELMNTLGQSVYQTSLQIEKGKFQKEMDFSQQKNGLYILRLEIGNKTYESKVMIN